LITETTDPLYDGADAMGRALFDSVPKLYRGFLPAFFHLPVAPERHATCSNCAMVDPGGAAVRGQQRFFLPSSKCCTYYPAIPNYLVGGLLAASDAHLAEGRSRIEHIIRKRIGIIPRGVIPSRKYTALYQAGVGAFGRTTSMVCPYFDADGGTCTVWDHRSAICSTYFCKYNHGREGWLFWTAFGHYLRHVELVLASYALDRLGFSADAVMSMEPSTQALLDADELDEVAPSDASYAAMWGEWTDREEELYLRCSEIVRSLDRDTFDRIGGIEHTLHLKGLQARYSEMVSPTLPEVLIRNPEIVVHPAGDNHVLVTGYGPVDPRRIRRELYQGLELFDGSRPWRQVIGDAGSEGATLFNEGLVTQLYHHRLLIDSD